MKESDEPNLLRALDETESLRRRRVAELNQGWSREELEAAWGKVWSTEELRIAYEVVGFFAPLVVVKSKADGSLGSLEFQHSPRFYFNFVRDEQ